MDTLSTPAANVFGPYPVVLTAIEDITHLVCSDSVHVFIITANFFPLGDRKKQNIQLQQIYKVCNYFDSNSCYNGKQVQKNWLFVRGGKRGRIQDWRF